MEIIRQNPYHVIGILAGANQRTIAKQKAKIKAWITTGKDLVFDTDIQISDLPERTNGTIEKAFANIEINQDKVSNALFWFANHNHLDETALTYLQSGDIKKAEDIWQKVTRGKEVSSKNFTAFNNLGTLKLATAFANGALDIENLKEGVRLKTKLLTSDKFSDFCYMVADETYTIDQNKELEAFINGLLEETTKQKASETKKIPALIGSIHPKLKSIVSEKLTVTPFYNIERKTEQTKKKRNNNPEDGLQLAKNLYRDTKNDLTTLSELLGKYDLKYKMVADKLAKELLQCGINYFKEYQEDEELLDGNLGEDVMKLFKTAKSIAAGTQTKERISENINGLQEWIDNADERRKQKLIEEDLRFITKELERFQRTPETIGNAEGLISSCKPRLQNMKIILGANDDFYLKISSAVVNNAQGMLVNSVNEAQKDYSVQIQMGHLEGLKGKIRDAIKVSEKLGTLDMAPELREHYNRNHHAIKSIGSQLGLFSYRSMKTTNHTSTMPSSQGHSYSSTNNEFSFSENAWWIFGLIGVIVGLIIGWGWGCIITGFIGIGFGSHFSD